jgi:hypothetical protein
VPQRIRSRWSCACGGQTMSLCRRAVEKNVRRAVRLNWVPRFHLGRATAQTTIGRCQLCGLLLVSRIDMRFFSPAAQSAGLQVTFGRQQFHAARHRHCKLAVAVPTAPVLSVQHAAKLRCTRDTEETCVRVHGVCHSAATGNLMRVPERRPGVYVTSPGIF